MVDRQPTFGNGKVDAWLSTCGSDPINFIVVWLRLLNLPMEYWDKDLILCIMSVASQPLALNGFTYHLQKFGFARIKVEIAASYPLKSGIHIRGWRNIPIIVTTVARLDTRI